MDELNIPKNANRIPILFEGCGVGLRGLAAAKHFCMDNPGMHISSNKYQIPKLESSMYNFAISLFLNFRKSITSRLL